MDLLKHMHGYDDDCTERITSLSIRADSYLPPSEEGLHLHALQVQRTDTLKSSQADESVAMVNGG